MTTKTTTTMATTTDDGDGDDGHGNGVMGSGATGYNDDEDGVADDNDRRNVVRWPIVAWTAVLLVLRHGSLPLCATPLHG